VNISKAVADFANPPQNFIFLGGAAIIFNLIYYRMKYGGHVIAVGNNELVAAMIGINVNRVKRNAFVVGGLFFGIAAILVVCYSGAISARMTLGSLSLVFQPMMGVMIGLELKNIYDNMAVNIFVGTLSMSIIFNGLIAAGLPSTIQDFVLGLFMVCVMVISINRIKVLEMIRRRRLRAQIER
jgi:ribose transport system permease protein